MQQSTTMLPHSARSVTTKTNNINIEELLHNNSYTSYQARKSPPGFFAPANPSQIIRKIVEKIKKMSKKQNHEIVEEITPML